MPRVWTDPLVQPKQWKGDMGFGTWNIRRVYRSGSLTTVAMELARYKLDFVGVWEEVGKRGNCKSRGLYFFLWKRKRKSSAGNRIFFVRYIIILAVKSVELVRDRRSYIVLRDRWCDIVWNVHVPSEVKGDNSKEFL